MQHYTIGKLRGLQEISNRGGIISILAADHRGSMLRMINRADPQSVTPQMLTERKLEITEALREPASAVLLDPESGAAAAIASGMLPGDTGLLVSTEESGYEASGDLRTQKLISGWNAEKVKRMGASAAKLLIHYRHDLGEVTQQQEDLVAELGRQCKELDLTLLVEAVSYARANQSAEDFAEEKPGMVVEAARRVSELGVDVFKAEFPTAHNNYDRSKLREFCRAVDDACTIPWVILSAGVTFDEFVLQTEIACECGASGFAAGRAIWQEAMPMSNDDERRYFLHTTALERLVRLVEIANRYATPWFRKLQLEPNTLTQVDPDWYKRY